MHCIYTNERYENFSFVFHAQNTEDSRRISFNSSNYCSITSKLDKHLENFKIYFCSRATLIRLCKDLLPKFFHILEVYLEPSQTFKMEILWKKSFILILAVNYFCQMLLLRCLTPPSSLHRYLPFFIQDISMYFENTLVLKLFENFISEFPRNDFKPLCPNNL